MNTICVLLSPLLNLIHQLLDQILSAAAFLGLAQTAADILNPIFSPLLACAGR